MIDPEMQALLSGYAAGTLTAEEMKRLNEAALNNQAIFDAMAEEEPLRAALTSSLAKKGLLRALQKHQETRDPLHLDAAAPASAPIEIPKFNNWLWGALAACLLVGAATVAYWPTSKNEIQEVAIATKPEFVSAPAPPQEPTPAAKARAKAPASPPPPAPAQAPVVIAESTVEKREAKSFEAPQAPAAALADSARQEIAAGASNSFKERNAPSVAKVASAPPPVGAEIFNDNLILRAANGSQIYAFLIDGDSIKPLSIANETRRSISLGSHSTKAEVWLLITTTEDPVLARALTGVLPLPTRSWIKLKANP